VREVLVPTISETNNTRPKTESASANCWHDFEAWPTGSRCRLGTGGADDQRRDA
jgi:hypothetical protein